MRPLTLAVLLAILVPVLTFSQPRPTDRVTQGIEWFQLSNNIKVSKRATLLAEGVFRFAGGFDPMQFQVRVGADIHVNENLTVMPLGYVYTWNPVYGKQPAKYVNNEHRLYQQAAYKHRIGRIQLLHRGRFEERYIQVHTMENGEVINHGYDLPLIRVRYRLMMNIPLNGAEIGSKTIYASFYDEIYMEFGKAIVYHKPDQNRVFAGLGYQANDKLTITGGFIYQMLV
ncbi:MAG TPA: DUF2490 domain-containing protein, partial [Cyclobacteriaceae bacterium]